MSVFDPIGSGRAGSVLSIGPENEAPAVRGLGDRRIESVHGFWVPRERVVAEVAVFDSGVPSL